MNAFDEAYKQRPLLFGAEPTPELVDAIKYFPIGGRALELGCGDGRDTLCVLESGLHVVALDLSEYAIKHLLEREEIKPFVPHALAARVADITKENLGSELYDFIYGITVMENFSRGQQEILESRMLNALTPGGYLFLTVHTEEDDGFNGDGSEFASEIKYYYKKSELLERLMPKGRVLYYKEAREEDIWHGAPHFHSFAHILLQKMESES